MTRKVRAAASAAGFCVAVLFATLLAQGIWTVLLSANLRSSPSIPWSVAIIAVLLWAAWRYSGGAWPPVATRAARRRYRRAEPPELPAFVWATGAGFLALGALIALWIVLVQLVKVPGNPAADFARYPPVTVISVLVMASLVGAITEEVGLRGYMLTRLEQAAGGRMAVLIVALAISPGHGITQGFVVPTLAWYFLADLMFGLLSLLARSILPGIVVHFTGLLTLFAVVWPADRFRQPVSLLHAGLPFWTEATICVLLAVLSVVAFRRLASMGGGLSSSRD
jgi:membrane protease YdiL (CAAX protease family)